MNSIDKWFTIEQIDEITFALSEYGHWEKMHSYLLLGSKYAGLIDTGLGISNIKRVIDQITNLPVKVITTHVHWDHIGGHQYYDEIYVHEREADWLINGIKGLPPIEQVRTNLIRDITVPIPTDFNISAYQPYRGTPTKVLLDNDIIDLGNRFLTVIHTPGHSPGHVCIYESERGYLYSGDLLYKGTLYANFPTTEPAEFAKSIEKIYQLEGVTKILPSHNEMPLTREFATAVFKAFLQLNKQCVIRHGTGLHIFDQFSISF